MSEVEGKLKWLQAVVLDQWKSGYAAELRLCCENGHLRVSLDADFGPPTSSWRTASVSASSVTSGRGSPPVESGGDRREQLQEVLPTMLM